MIADKRTGTVFKTDLGWFGLAWSGLKLARVTFGHPNKQDAKSETVALEAVSMVATSQLSAEQRELVDRFLAYAAGAPEDFSDVSLRLPHATPFQRQILLGCRQIGWGQTRTYGELAAQAGSPHAARAAGTVMASNRLPIVIPCHRVVAANRKLGGFSAPGGIQMKERLLRLESLSSSLPLLRSVNAEAPRTQRNRAPRSPRLCVSIVPFKSQGSRHEPVHGYDL
jgi:methylated-DNA-[protein]-cysteine S-methyltransferase